MNSRDVITLSGRVGGPDFSARQLADLPSGPLKVVIDSGGGDTLTAFSAYQTLIEHPGDVTIEIVKAGSAATLVAMGGRRRLIHATGHFFLHRAWGATIGTAPTLREAADLQDEWDHALAEIYAERAGLTLERVLQLMDNESTLCPAEALALGFAHEIIGSQAEPLIKQPNLPEHTALACLTVEDFQRTPVTQAARTEAIPAARRVPAVDVIMNKPALRPPIPANEAATALERYCENDRREAGIRQHLARRLRRAINCRGRVDWPVRCDWLCGSCGSENFHPPARHRLATPCRNCGANSPEIST